MRYGSNKIKCFSCGCNRLSRSRYFCTIWKVFIPIESGRRSTTTFINKRELRLDNCTLSCELQLSRTNWCMNFFPSLRRLLIRSRRFEVRLLLKNTLMWFSKVFYVVIVMWFLLLKVNLSLFQLQKLKLDFVSWMNFQICRPSIWRMHIDLKNIQYKTNQSWRIFRPILTVVSVAAASQPTHVENSAFVDGSVGQSNTFSVTHAFSIEHSVSIVPNVPPSPPIPTNTHPMQTIYKSGIHNLKFTLPSS